MIAINFRQLINLVLLLAMTVTKLISQIMMMMKIVDKCKNKGDRETNVADDNSL